MPTRKARLPLTKYVIVDLSREVQKKSLFKLYKF